MCNAGLEIECFSWFTRVYPNTFGMDSLFIFVLKQNSKDESFHESCLQKDYKLANLDPKFLKVS